MNLKNKVVIVTGSTSGIGFEIVKEVLSLGGKVMLHSSHRSEENAKKLVAELGENTSYVCADLAVFSDLENIVTQTVKHFGKVDCLVNNAGVFPRNNIFEMDEEFYDYVMNINYKAPLFLCQAVVKEFQKQKIKGSIVNVGSLNAYCGATDLLVYSSSKGALMTMTKNLADFLGEYSIRVNQLNVGWTHTDKEHEVQQAEGNPEDWHKRIPKVMAPRGTILAPDEIAKHVAFWLSDYSIPVTGAVYEVEQYPVLGRIKQWFD